MQMILATDGMYTYLMFNYDQEEFSIQPEAYISLSSGYTYPDNMTGEILSNRTTFMNLKNGSNVNPRRTLFSSHFIHVGIVQIALNILFKLKCDRQRLYLVCNCVAR